MIRKMAKQDIPTVVDIYQEGIDTGIATFETIAPTPAQWDIKFHNDLRYVYEENGVVLGWISVTPISSREVYKGVAEISIYVRKSASGKGIGSALFEVLCEESRKLGYWMLQSSIFEKNIASISLHEKVGFRLVGVREKIAKRNGHWHNTVLMEKRLVE